MKKSIILTITSISFFAFFSCTSHEKEHKETSTEHASTTAVQLDNGNPWQANPETTAGIYTMQMMVDAFPENADMAASKSLKAELENEFKLIFDKCTMTGEAHNQLHNYLLPMKALFAKLDSPDPEVSKAAVSELKEHLALYSKYFA